MKAGPRAQIERKIPEAFFVGIGRRRKNFWLTSRCQHKESGADGPTIGKIRSKKRRGAPKRPERSNLSLGNFTQKKKFQSTRHTPGAPAPLEQPNPQHLIQANEESSQEERATTTNYGGKKRGTANDSAGMKRGAGLEENAVRGGRGGKRRVFRGAEMRQESSTIFDRRCNGWWTRLGGMKVSGGPSDLGKPEQPI